MPDSKTPETVENPKKRKTRFTQPDWNAVSQFVMDELSRRKQGRKDMERYWQEVDRQLCMEPASAKLAQDGAPAARKAWMSELELPFQAQTLEVLTADARRMMFPDTGLWFTAHAALTDEYLRRVDFTSMIAGDENDVPSAVNQDAADKLVEGWMHHLHSQYGFEDVADLVNAEAFKYGVGVARLRPAKKPAFTHTARGVVRDTVEMPIVVPRSIKHTYLDDRPARAMNEGFVMGPGTIFVENIKYDDLMLAAKRGGSAGGWIARHVSKVDKPENNTPIRLVEYEGDVIVPRKTTENLFLPSVIVTVAEGAGKDGACVVRFRKRPGKTASYFPFHYHREDIDSAYSTSPLLKGRPIQMVLTEAVNRMIDSAALSIQPPIQVSPDAAAQPEIYPGALWESADPIEVYDQIGDSAKMLNVFSVVLQQYFDVTGVNSPRLGAQTNSHTTAFAKEAEISRGTIRTVDYVKTQLDGPMAQMLHAEYEMSRDMMKGEQQVYLPTYRGFVDITKEALPDNVVFEAHGAGGPAEKRQKMQDRMQALQFAVSLETLKVQLGEQPSLNLNAAQQEVLREGGWIDIDQIITDEPGAAEGSESPGGLAPASQGNPGAAALALQAIPAATG